MSAANKAWHRNASTVCLVLLLATAALVPLPGGAQHGDAPHGDEPHGHALHGHAPHGEPEDGHWENLGEDGHIWVPSEEPAILGHLPGEDLGAYHNYTETSAVLHDLAATRPDLFTLTPIGTSVDGRTLWMMRVTGPGDATGRAQVLLDGAHHGNEVIGSEILTRFLIQVHAEYDTDPLMQDALAHAIVDVIPMVNVDSVQRVPDCSHYAMCRKNSNGVDLNRNYADHWGGAGSSSSPGADTYRGPAPLSEPESQAVAAILDLHDYALHASFHSGIELILWPHGWTTDRPADHAVYESLGAELTGITNVPHGQISRALYLASGTTVDQAYGSAAGWRPISFTPEVHGGPGNAFNWWHFFNPDETEASVMATVNKWLPAVWHLVAEAPRFAPPVLDITSLLAFGPGAVQLPISIAAPERRPFVDATLLFDASGAPIYVDSQNPVALPGAGGSLAFSLVAYDAGIYPTSLVLDAGQAGTLRTNLQVDLLQITLALELSHASMGSPDVNIATATIDAGPFEAASGQVVFTLQPGGDVLATKPFSAQAGTPAEVSVGLHGHGLADGAYRVVATATFTATLDGDPRPGIARLDTPFSVLRPQLEATKEFPTPSAVLAPLVVRSTLVNTGSMPAHGVIVTETVPPGYLYWPYDDPVLPPTDPLGSPTPDRVEVRSDGSVDVTWLLGSLAPGGAAQVAYRITPLVAGETELASNWHYVADYDGLLYGYQGNAAPTHEAQ